MYRRSLPPFPDLSSFLAYLDGKGGVRTIAAPIDMNLEITEVHRRVIATGGPVLRFERPIAGGRPSSLPVIANLFGTRERVAAGLGTTPVDLERLGAFMAWMRAPQPPKSIAEAGRLFPAARAAALQSRPKFVSEPKAWMDCSAGFCPICRCKLAGRATRGRSSLGPSWLRGRPATTTLLPIISAFTGCRSWTGTPPSCAGCRCAAVPPITGCGRREGSTCPWLLSSAPIPPQSSLPSCRRPEGVSELALAGMLGGRRPELAPCRTIPLHVPASAEIVLEGTVSPTETALEGPFGDHTGYYNPPEPFPVFRLKHMRIREPGVYLTTFTGRAPDEPSVIADAMLDIFKPLLKQQLPEILDVWLPPEACSYRIAVLADRQALSGAGPPHDDGFLVAPPAIHDDQNCDRG